MSLLSRDAPPRAERTLGEDTAEEVPMAGGAVPDDTQYPPQL